MVWADVNIERLGILHMIWDNVRWMFELMTTWHILHWQSISSMQPQAQSTSVHITLVSSFTPPFIPSCLLSRIFSILFFCTCYPSLFLPSFSLVLLMSLLSFLFPRACCLFVFLYVCSLSCFFPLRFTPFFRDCCLSPLSFVLFVPSFSFVLAMSHFLLSFSSYFLFIIICFHVFCDILRSFLPLSTVLLHPLFIHSFIHSFLFIRIVSV